jgi:hypothetical protein
MVLLYIAFGVLASFHLAFWRYFSWRFGKFSFGTLDLFHFQKDSFLIQPFN